MGENPKIVQELINRLEADKMDVVEKLKSLRISNPAGAAIALYSIVRAIVIEIEDIANDIGGIPGVEKKQALVEFVNNHLDIPLLTEEQEADVIGLACDVIVGELNALHGHKWIVAVTGFGKKLWKAIKSIFPF